MQPKAIISIERKNFATRVLRSLAVPCVIMFSLTAWLKSRDASAVYPALVVFLFFLWLLECCYLNRFYIISINWDSEGIVSVSYDDFGRSRQITANIASVHINKGLLWSEFLKQPFLTLTFHGHRVEIKQFLTGEWNELVIDKLLMNWPIPTKSSPLTAA